MWQSLSYRRIFQTTIFEEGQIFDHGNDHIDLESWSQFHRLWKYIHNFVDYGAMAET